MCFHALAFARSRGSCLYIRPEYANIFRGTQQVLVNAMKKHVGVIVILAYFT